MGQTERKPPRLAALDTCVLLDLADHHTPAWKKLKSVREEKPTDFKILPTVIVELMAHVEGCVPEKQRLSFLALRESRGWGIQPINFIGTGHGINLEIAKTILRMEIIPDDQWNDANILAEAGLAGCDLLVTNDGHLKDADPNKLREAFDHHDASIVRVVGY